MTGEIKNIQERGFGFILAEDHKEYFFHRSGYLGDWDELRRDASAGKVYVEFEPDAHNKKGPRAENIERLDQ